MFTTMWPLFVIVGLAVVAIGFASCKKLRGVSTYVRKVTVTTEVEVSEEVFNKALDLMAQRRESEEYQLEVLRSARSLGTLPLCLKDLDLTNLAAVRSTLNASLAARDASR